MSKSVVRSVKNVTKGYSSVQVKVRNGMTILSPLVKKLADALIAATSNDAWGPSGGEMTEIAQMTYNK